MPDPAPQTLSYEMPRNGAELLVEHGPDGSVTVTVPTRRSARRYIGAWIKVDLRSAMLAPVAYLLFKLLATGRPRAVLRLTPEEFILTQTDDDGLGLQTRTQAWPLAVIGELRPNRFERGLWLTITGRDCLSFLGDVPPAEVAAIGAVLTDARQRLLSPTT